MAKAFWARARALPAWAKSLPPWAKRTGLGLLAGLVLLAALDLAFPPPMERYEERSTLVLDREGGILRAFLTSDGLWRLPAAPDQVDADYLRLLLAYEDRRFRYHPGVDPLALARATGQWIASGRIVSGGSTLTMQAARLLEPGGRGLGSKAPQIVRALQLERRYSKAEILSVYLTLAPFGGNIEGVRAAALAYFGKEPDRLSLEEAALLIALPQAPEARRPDRRAPAARAARDKVLRLLVERSALGNARAREAQASPVPATRGALPFRAPRLARELKAARPPGTVIRTEIDPAVQSAVERLAARERPFLEHRASLAILVIENETRAVRGYLGGADFARPGGQMDLGAALRSPGSTLKPFVYAMAFDDLGVHPETLIDDRPTAFGDYAPQNFDRGFAGTVSLAHALQQSLNVPAVALLDGVGPTRLAARLRQVGAHLAFSGAAAPSLPLALGGVGTSLRDLAMLYAGLAQGGKVAPLRFLASDPRADGRRVMSAAAAWYVRDILAGSPLPEGRAQGQGLTRPRGAAFKTGTSYGFRDAWAFAMSERYTVAAWVGRPDGTPRPDRIGRLDAAPLALQLFDALPPEPGYRTDPPADILHAADWRDLPPGMQIYASRKMGLRSQRPGAGPPVIAFPPDGAAIPLPETAETLPLRATGGVRPFRWLVNGAVLPPTGYFESAFFEPDGEGFAEIAVVDADGRSARSRVRFVKR